MKEDPIVGNQKTNRILNNHNEKNNARFRNPSRGYQDVPAGEGVPEVSGGV